MTKDRFLTVRWNNILSLILGIPILTYVVVVLSTTILSASVSFIGLVILGVFY